MKKNRFLSLVLLAMVCTVITCQSAYAEEKTVKLSVPGCT